jgi:metal-responsive CopG/Arc/MetJ family transcriptional regulator
VQLLLEPRPTRQLNLKADQQLVDDVDAVAERLGASRSAIARALIRSALAVLEREVD